MKEQLPFENNSGGYITLMSVLIVGVVGLAVSLSALWLGIVNTQNSLTVIQAAQARAIAGACVEVAARNVAQSSTYTGTVSLNIDTGSCTAVTTIVNGNSSITATATVGTLTRRIAMVTNPLSLNSSGTLAISSWLEAP